MLDIQFHSGGGLSPKSMFIFTAMFVYNNCNTGEKRTHRESRIQTGNYPDAVFD